MQRKSPGFPLLAVLVWALQACGSPESSGAAAQGVGVTVQPPAAEVAAGKQVGFAATVTGTADLAVVWEVVEVGGGAVDASGLYTAPATAGTFHVRASSRANPAAQASAVVIVTPPVAVAVVPRTASVLAGGTIPFSATVTGATNQGVTWAVQEASGCGSITSGGVYTAPSAAATCHVVATSVADTSAKDVATVTVTPPVAVAISPATASVAAGGTVTFTATVTGASNTGVTWSVSEPTGCGSVTQAGVYTAPATAATCHVVATSVADSTKRATATVSVSAPPPPVAVSISPATGSVHSCQTLRFTATVANASNTSVTWSVQEGAAGGTIDATGLYTGPDVAGTYHVVATSQADPSRSATVPVDVTDLVLAVAVSPPTITVPAGGTAQFTATVTTTCGTFSALRTVTASAAGLVTGN